MPIEAELPDGRILEFPDGTSPAVIQSAVKRLLAAGREAPETTVGGNVKEFFKGVVPGAIGLVESAATGASAILPEDAEKATRKFVKETATSLKEPFTAAPGYGQSVGRKGGEAVGSTLPFFALGPLGVAGKVAAGGLGTAAGAGEARQRAEIDGATGDQRGTATALGAVVGATEILPVFKFLDALSTPVKDGILSYVRRAAVTGGAEGAQEAAAQLAQNLIAQGIYKPEQSLIEGTGESAAYGAGVGALIQGITDMALGRRGGGSGAAGGFEAAPDSIESARAEDAKKAAERAAAKEAAKATPTEPTAPADVPLLPGPDAVAAPVEEEAAAPVAEEVATPATDTKHPKVRKPRRKNAARNTEQSGTAETVGETSPAPDIAGVGVDSESGGQTTVPPDADGVDVPETPTPTGNGDSAGDVETLNKEWRAAVRRGEPAETLVAINEQITKAKRKRKEKIAQEAETPAPVAPEAAAQPDTVTPPAPEPVRQGTDTRVRNVEADAVEQQRSRQKSIKALERARQGRNALMRQRQDYVTAQENLYTPGGNILPQKQAAFDEVSKRIAEIDAQLEGANKEIRGLANKVDREEGTVVEDAPVTEADKIDRDEEIDDIKQRIDQAVGAYNNEGSVPNRRKLAVQYIFDELAANARKNLAPPSDTESNKSKLAKYNYALNALAYGVDTKDLTTPQRLSLFRVLGLDPQATERLTTTQQRKAIEAAADKALKGEAQAWGDQLFQKGSSKRNSDDEQLDIYLELRGKTSPIEVAEWLAASAPNREYKRIATRAAQRMRAMEKRGTLFKFSVTNVLEGALGRVENFIGEQDGKVTTWVMIRGFGSDRTGANTSNGLNYETILHEIVHAATSAAVNSSLNFPIKRRMEALLAHVRKYSPEIGTSNQLDNVDELLTWGLTNPEVREKLEAIPYKGGNIVSKIIESIREFLGLSPKADTALTELLTISEEIFDADVSKDVGAAGRFNQIATPETQAVAAQGATAERKARSLTGDVKAKLGKNKLLGLRVAFTDALAAADDIFTKAYNGRIRDNEGNLNPIVLISRALDALRVSKAVQESGGLFKDPSGLFIAGELTVPAESSDFPLIAGQTVSYQKVIERISREAKQTGKSYEQVRTIVDEVLYGRREFELREAERQGKGPFEYLLTEAQATAANDAYNRNQDIQEISQMLDAVRYNLIDAMVTAGRISEEKATAYKEATAYIPFSRLSEFDQAYSATRGANRGLAALRNVKKFKGSDERKSSSVVENFSGLVDWATRETMKNDAALRALEDLRVLQYARRIPTPDVIDKDKRGGIASIYKDGEQVHYFMEDPALAVVFSDQTPQVSNILRGMQKASQILRAGVTAAPPFALKQVADDIIRAYVYGGAKNPGKLAMRILSGFPKNWYNEVFNKKSAGVSELEKLGIIGTFDFTESSNLKSILEESGAKKRGLGANILRVMEAGAKASDVSVRQAIYAQILEETGDKAAAESRAREIINFSRRGNARMMDYMIRIVPFFNAYARGMDKLAVSAAGNSVGLSTGQARSRFYQRMSVLTAMGLTYAILMSDDDEYNAQPDHVRDQNWILPFGKELGFTPSIPIPAELAFFFKAIPERVVQYIRLSGTDEERAALSMTKDLLLRGVDVFSSPNITPQLLKPIFENYTNYSFFLGRPLESQSQQKLRPFERYGSGTSELARWIAEKLEDGYAATGIDATLSPIKIENLIRGIFGTTAGTVLAFSDMVMNPTRTDRPIHTALGAQLTGVSAFMKDGIGTRYLDEIYNLEKRTEEVHGTFNRLRESDPERAADFLEANMGLYSVRPAVSALMDRIRALAEISRTIDRSKDMDPAEKRKFVDEFKEYQMEIAREVFRLNKLARDAQVAAE